jgi:hypothetical protein
MTKIKHQLPNNVIVLNLGKSAFLCNLCFSDEVIDLAIEYTNNTKEKYFFITVQALQKFYDAQTMIY